MKKLGSVEKIDEFILAIAGGANVNGTWKGSPLVKYYFTEAMRHVIVYPTDHPKSSADINMLKLQAIVSAGADISPLFRSAYEYYEYGNLVRLIGRRLELLQIVLSSKQAKEFIESDCVYRKDLSELRDQLLDFAKTIEKMDVLDQK